MKETMWLTYFLLKDEEGKREDIRLVKKQKNKTRYQMIAFHLEIRGQEHILSA